MVISRPWQAAWNLFPTSLLYKITQEYRCSYYLIKESEKTLAAATLSIPKSKCWVEPLPVSWYRFFTQFFMPL